MMLRTLARSLFCGLLFSSFLGARADDLAAQPVDADYTAKIREYTTEPFFLTELVDHLPLSDRVPSPKKALGYVVGTPEKLTYSKGINAYFRALAAASPRVKVWTIGKSEGGREMILAAVSSEENMGRIDHYKQITAKLADPRKTTDAERADLVRESRPFYWLSGSIHSPETGSPEMLMELAFRLAVDESAHVQAIRNNLIVLFTPVVEVDGRDRMLDVYRYRKANPGKQTPGLVYWGQYVAHDNNRDAMGLALALSNVMLKTFLDWHPQVFHDLHESVPYLYTSTGTGPYNSWLDPIVVSEWQKLAYHEIEGMTRRGVPGVWTHGFYDGWAPNYMFYMANGHNAIGRFYETFGNGGADTRERKLPASATSRTWYRPNPPLPRVKWSIRNNINLQESALLLALKYVGDNREEFVNNFALKSQRSVAKARTEGPAAWIIPNDGKRPALAAQLARLLQRQGAEVHRLDRETEVKVAKPAPPHGGPAAPSAENRAPDSKAETAKPTAQKVAAGSYVVRMDQPYSRIVDMMLDTQYFSTTDPRPYDDTGWTFGPLRNVVTLRVVDPSILGAPMTKIDGEARAAGGVLGSGSAWFVLNANAEPALATLRFRLKDVKMLAAEEPFEVEGKKYSAGSFLIPSAGNPEDLRSRLQAATTSLGLRARAVGSEIRAKRHAISVPRIALLHTWVSTQNDGWFRLALDECEVPYSYISDQDIRAAPDLKAKYDVIIFPPVTSSLPTLINGVRKRLLDDGSDFGGPVPFKSTGLTPNLNHAVIGDRERTPRVLFHQDDGESVLPAQPDHQVHDLGHDPGRQAERGLVEQQHPRLRQQRPRDDQHLPLAAGQRGGQLAPAVGEWLEALVGFVERGGPFGPRIAMGRGPAKRAWPGHHDHTQVLLDGEIGNYPLPLGHVRDPGPDDLLGAAAGQVGAAQQDAAAAGLDHAADRAQQRGLAGAVRAEHRRDGRRPSRDADPVQRDDPAVSRIEPIDGQRRGSVLLGGRATHRRDPAHPAACGPRRPAPDRRRRRGRRRSRRDCPEPA